MTQLLSFSILGSIVSGSAPQCIASLTNLNSLNIGSTLLSGTVPSARTCVAYGQRGELTFQIIHLPSILRTGFRFFLCFGFRLANPPLLPLSLMERAQWAPSPPSPSSDSQVHP